MVAQQSDTDRRRAIELLAGSAKQGCTEAFLLAHGFTVELLVEMVRRAVNGNRTRKESLKQAGARLRKMMPPRKRYDRRQEPHHDLRSEV
jgi:hypothetical protein